MLLSDFDYHLPADLIAEHPLEKRSDSRLLCLSPDKNEITHRKVSDLINLLSPNDLLVFNNTKVIPARLHGHKDSGGAIEVLVEKIMNKQQILAQVRASKPLQNNRKIIIKKNAKTIEFTCIEKIAELYRLSVPDNINIWDILDAFGEVPLPPYIKRPATTDDESRYQTVFAEQPGAVAAPTAGLHFDEDFFKQLNKKNINYTFITLHVGLGTFQPIRVENIKEHEMHSEYLEISEQASKLVQTTKKNKGKVIAIGTTTVRCLESCYKQFGSIKSFRGETQLFIYPGFQFQCIDAMITNFHLPKSSLLLLVSAFAGYENTKLAYQTAIDNKYRFYSYGDAMFIMNKFTESNQTT